jgi:ubiquinone/menaquinone biosynthesis C-methylase UbiE
MTLDHHHHPSTTFISINNKLGLEKFSDPKTIANEFARMLNKTTKTIASSSSSNRDVHPLTHVQSNGSIVTIFFRFLAPAVSEKEFLWEKCQPVQYFPVENEIRNKFSSDDIIHVKVSNDSQSRHAFFL